MSWLYVALIIIFVSEFSVGIAKIVQHNACKKDVNNPFEGKKVIFINSETDDENADGEKGHLEVVGDDVPSKGFYVNCIKRIIDIVASLCGMVLISPLLIVIVIAIIIDDPGPAFFTQKRIGQNKKYFRLYKFRSMKMCTPHDTPTHMLENPEQYITKVGKFTRKHSLDELPQLLNVLDGSLSLVGVRPGLWNQDVLTAERDKYGVNSLKPGITGWAQINGRDSISIEDKSRLDGYYKEHQSFLFDLKCLIGTVSKVGHDDTFVEGGTGELARLGRHYTDDKTIEELIGQIGFGKPVIVDKTQKKSVLITGSGSYIGSYFEQYAKDYYNHNFAIDICDTLDEAWVKKDFSKYDVVYHVAGIAHTDVGNISDDIKEKYYKVNTDLTVDVAKKAKSEGAKIFIFMSSMIVYGDSATLGKNRLVDENTVPNPANFYGDSKLQADVAVRDLASDDFKVLVLRPPMIYGKDSKGNYPILAKLAEKLPLFPRVSNSRSMLYIENLCEFLCQIMLATGYDINSCVLFPQNAEWTTTSKMVELISKVRGKRIFVTKILTPLIYLASKLPGKISKLVNKAFGNMCYEHSLSEYAGIDYQLIDIRESIIRTESDV